jgi:hypothetical protein
MDADGDGVVRFQEVVALVERLGLRPEPELLADFLNRCDAWCRFEDFRSARRIGVAYIRCKRSNPKQFCMDIFLWTHFFL